MPIEKIDVSSLDSETGGYEETAIAAIIAKLDEIIDWINNQEE